MCLGGMDSALLHEVSRMGWQNFLNNSATPLEQRLHGARVAFFSSSAQLSTHQKEDVVVQWLSRLVKEKQDTTWRSENCSEQDSVWALLADVFTSDRLQVLVQHKWTCPVTSTFPQIMVDVLGSPSVTATTRQYIVATVAAMLRTPAIAPVITNSSTTSLHLTTALLDIAANTDWQAVAANLAATHGDARLQEADSLQPRLKRARIGLIEEEDEEAIEESEPDRTLLPEERVLQALVSLLDSVRLQMLAKSNDEAMTLCSHLLLKRVATFTIAIEPYHQNIKVKLIKQLDNLVSTCLFNCNVFPQYRLFLTHLMLEDSKVINEQSAVHIMLSMCSDIIARESIPVLKLVISQFYVGFLDKCVDDNQRILMLVTLLHLVDVVVPGDLSVDPNCLAISFVDIHKVKTARREAVMACLMEVLMSAKKEIMSAAMKAYLKSLLLHLMDHKPKTSDGFQTFRCILSMSSVRYLDELPSILGHLITWTKSNDEAYQVYEVQMLELLKCYTLEQRVGQLITTLLQGIVLCKDNLICHSQFLPPLCPTDKGQRQLLPGRFLDQLSVSVRALEPLLLCPLLQSLLEMAVNSVLPLLEPATEGGSISEADGRAVAACLWVVSEVLDRAPRSGVRVAGLAGRVVATMRLYLTDLLLPALTALTTNEHENASCCGLLMLCRAWSDMLCQLKFTVSDFAAEWQKVESGALDVSLTPHTPAAPWALLQTRLHSSGDQHARYQMIVLWLHKLRQVCQERDRLQFLVGATRLRAVVKKRTKRGKNGVSDHAGPQLEMKRLDEIQDSLASYWPQVVQQWRSESAAVVPLELHKLVSVLDKQTHQRLLVELILAEYPKNMSEWRSTIVQCESSTLAQKLRRVALQQLLLCVELTPPSGKRKSLDSEDTTLVSSDDDEQPVMSLLKSISASLKTCIKTQNVKKKKSPVMSFSTKCGAELTTLIKSLIYSNKKQYVRFENAAKAKNLLQILIDLSLCHLTGDDQVLFLVALFALFLHTDLSLESEDPTSSLLLVAINECLSLALPTKFDAVVDVSLLLCRVITVQTRLPSTTLEAVPHYTRQPLVLNTNALIGFLAQRLILSKEERLQSVSAFIVISAKTACSEQGHHEEEKFLRPAWLLVLACSQYLSRKDDSNQSRQELCSKTVRSLGSWCMRVLHRQDLRTVTGTTAAHSLSIYTALIRVEAAKELGKSGSTTDPEEGQIAATECVSGWAGETQTSLSGGPKETTLDVTLNGTIDEGSDGGKAKRWLRYLEDGVNLAKVCLSSNVPALESTAMSFIVAIKLLPASLLQTLPDDVFRHALNFFTKVPTDSSRYKEAYEKPDPDNLDEQSLVQPSVLVDPVSGSDKPLSLTTFLVDCPVAVYESHLNDLLKRALRLDDGLMPHTAAVWTTIINTPASPAQVKVKRAALCVLVRSLVWHLAVPAGAGQPPLKGSVMLSVLQLLQCVMLRPIQLPHQTVANILPAVTSSTRHLSLAHFVKVWESQATLLESSLLTRETSWPDRVAGLMAALTKLLEELVLRSDQNIVHARTDRESLGSCCRSLERLMLKLRPLRENIAPVVHLTLGGLVQALHLTTVVAPVKTSLELLVCQLFKMSNVNAVDHLLAALPTATQPLLQHYSSLYQETYAYR